MANFGGGGVTGNVTRLGLPSTEDVLRGLNPVLVGEQAVQAAKAAAERLQTWDQPYDSAHTASRSASPKAPLLQKQASEAVPITPLITPTASDYAAMNALDWTVAPKAKPAYLKPKYDSFEYLEEKAKDMPRHDYGLSEDQVLGLEATYEDQMGFQKEPDSKGAGTRVKAPKVETAPVTWEQLDAMSEEQRKAVAFSTLLSRAVRKDLKANVLVADDPSLKATPSNYNRRVDAMFGASGGSELRALNTVELLESIDFSAVGQDLDEFLSMERGVEASELKDFSLSADDPVFAEFAETGANPPGTGRRSRINPDAWDNTGRQPRDTTVRGKTVVNAEELYSPENRAALDSLVIRGVDDLLRKQNAEQPAWDLRSSIPADLGIAPDMKITDIPYGFAEGRQRTNDKDSPEYHFDNWYKDRWSKIIEPQNGRKEILAALAKDFSQYDFSEQEKQDFWDWIDNQTRHEMQFGAPGGRRTPEEIREMFGLEG